MSACTCGHVHSVNLRRIVSALTRTRWPVWLLGPILVIMFTSHAVGMVALFVGLGLVLLRLGRLVPWRLVAWHLRPMVEAS